MGTLFLVPKELRSRLIPPLTITLITYFYVLIVDSEALFALFLNFSVIIFFLLIQEGKRENCIEETPAPRSFKHSNHGGVLNPRKKRSLLIYFFSSSSCVPEFDLNKFCLNTCSERLLFRANSLFANTILFIIHTSQMFDKVTIQSAGILTER
jgi:hypothetical protein